MLAVDPDKRRQPLLGTPQPRVAPPRPLRSRVNLLTAEARCMGIEFMPWQDNAGTYLYAVGKGDAWLYPENADIVARQNGKTEILKPHICRRLRMGRRIMHTAQNRELPREVFGAVAEHMVAKHADELASMPRFANGQEEIKLLNGGRYRIVAPTRGGARGPSNDDLIIDEIRELADHDFIAAAKPTLSASANPQTLYLSNAGTDESAVLNALRARAGEDPSLAYLEWSAAPERTPDDIDGWREANPAIGHLPGKLDNLYREFRANQLGNTMPVFETEYLCRWQVAMDARLIQDHQWLAQDFGELGRPTRAVMAVNMDITGERASAVIAWPEPDDHIALDVHDTKGSPIDVTLLGPDLQALATANRVIDCAYDPYTDADLVRYLRRARAINGREYASATEKFVRLVTERKLRVNDPQGVLAEDLRWTTRRKAAFSSYMAVKANDEHTNTGILAAIRATWLASNPVPTGPARIQ